MVIQTAETRMEMEDREAMAVDPDEAYVSGNLSSDVSYVGEDKAAPSSLGAPLSLNADAGVERRKMGGKGRDGVGKSVSQLSGRRKSAHPSRRGGTGVGGSGDFSLGKTTKSSSGSLPTPTTMLSYQIKEMGLMGSVIPGGKRTRAERTDDMSPMSDAEGGSHSLNDPGYSSLTPGALSLEQPNSLPKERGQSGIGGSGPEVGDQMKDISLALKPGIYSVQSPALYSV